MRTLDRNYLATHPEGDERAEFTVSVPVQHSVDVPDNPDGTRPKVTLKASSDTYGDLLAVLSYVHDEDVAENVLALVLENADEERLEAFETIEAAAPFIRASAAKIVSPFRTFELSLNLESEDGPVVRAVLELTAPNIITAAQALKAMAKPRVLQELAISFSPEIEDDEYEEYAGNEVLVVS